MCADLITLGWVDSRGRQRREIVTLDDISAAGARLRIDEALPVETPILVQHPKASYRGRIKYCIYEQDGYYAGVAWDDGYRWSKTDFEPSHLLEIPDQPRANL